MEIKLVSLLVAGNISCVSIYVYLTGFVAIIPLMGANVFLLNVSPVQVSIIVFLKMPQ